MSYAHDIHPVRLDGSLDPHTRFPYKTGDEVAIVHYGGTNDAGEQTHFFVRARVIANDMQTGTMVIMYAHRDVLDTMDPTWTDSVVRWDDSFPTLASVIDEETWNRVEKGDKRLIPNGLGGRIVRSIDLPNRTEA